VSEFKLPLQITIKGVFQGSS